MRKRSFAVLLLAAAACGGDSTEPESTPWYVGTWRAVRANNAPLTYQYQLGGTTYTVDSMRVEVYAYSPQKGFFSHKGVRFTGAGGTPVPDTYASFVDVIASDDSLNIQANQNAIPGRLYITFRRQGDTLVQPTYLGAEWKLVRVP